MTGSGSYAGRGEKLKILLVGHGCSPDLGSEPGFTWNWAWHLSEHHDVWVISHPQFRAEVEAVVARHGGRAPRVVWVNLPNRLDPWDPAQGERRIHFHYVIWQRLALAEARRLHARQGFDIVHHVSWGTVNDPPALWRLGPPFVWGPVGGGQAAPLAFARYLGWRGSAREAGRTVRRRLVPFLPSLRRAAANSALILATNHETREVLHKAGATRVDLFLDGGARSGEFITRKRMRAAGDRLELLWAGRLEARKGLPLALEAMARVADLRVRLRIAGEGPLRGAYQRQADALGLRDRVDFLGFVPRDRLRSDLFPTSDAFLFTSLQDSFGTVVVEAMAAQLPLIGLDHQGFGALIPAQAAIKVPVTTPEATIQGLADGIRALAASPELGHRMSEAAVGHAASESWSRRVDRMNQLYRYCLGRSGGHRGGRMPACQGDRPATTDASA
jgi:glycosyltransferase involved in cell wall biosynthesis